MREPLDHLAALAAAQRTFSETLAQADPEAPVPACGPWRVADLALHLGGVHWWAAAMAHGVDLDPHEPPGPRDADTLVRFYVWAAASLRRTLVDLGPNAPSLTLDGPGTAAFWRRRQLHETLVHLWDLGASCGVDVSDVGDILWADAIDEVVDVLTPRQVRLGRMAALTESVALRSTTGRSWHVGPAQWPAAAEVTGPARALALLLWRRIGPGDHGLTVRGDAEALDRTLAAALTP
ncbi:MAG TPA: maleylpyruvate isomerase family mycothiol-dependent enzyme [Actinotalea sp.]|nr:maleylpyruvate isomerase family mycothiol-dependent enzyme [Actinotalea sp.]